MRAGVLSLAPVVGALCLAGSSGAAGSASFADKAADAGVAPDVTAVTVSNDDRGLVTFRVTIANRSALGPDDVVAIPLATDDPGRFGARQDGANFILLLDGTSGVQLLRWNGGDMVALEPLPASVTGSFADEVMTLTVRQIDLAPGFPDLSLPTKLAFYVLGIAFSGSEILGQDEAPDTSAEVWSYTLVLPRRIILTYFHAPKTIHAGAAVVTHLGAAWSDTGRFVTPTKIGCRAKLGGRGLRGPAPRFTRYAVCSWRVPKSARGKTVRGSITLTTGRMSVSRSFTTRVR